MISIIATLLLQLHAGHTVFPVLGEDVEIYLQLVREEQWLIIELVANAGYPICAEKAAKIVRYLQVVEKSAESGQEEPMIDVFQFRCNHEAGNEFPVVLGSFHTYIEFTRDLPGVLYHAIRAWLRYRTFIDIGRLPTAFE